MTIGRLVLRPRRRIHHAFLASHDPIVRCLGCIATPAPNQRAPANRRFALVRIRTLLSAIRILRSWTFIPFRPAPVAELGR